MAAIFCAESSIKLDARSGPRFLKKWNWNWTIAALHMYKLKRNKATAATAIQHTAIHKFKLTSCAQGWTCKTSKWQTVSNKTQKMHKQTKQQNPPFKSTLSNERIFLSICFECPTCGWISWRFLFFVCFFFGSNSCLFTVIADDLHVFSLFRVWV